MKRTAAVLAAALLVCLAASGGLFMLKRAVCGGIYDQTAAERWKSGDRSYVQLSLFISETANAGQSAVNELRGAISEKLTAESVTAESEGADIFFDAYSALTQTSVSRDGKSVQASAYFTGGDFFRFHSLDMESGWYYNEYDIMDDGVLINTYAAWQMYGSYDIVGKQIEVSGYPCVVYGVFDDSGENSQGKPVIYASYSLLYKLGQPDLPITCYEIVLPELVSNFGENLLRDAVTIAPEKCELVKNTGRYGFWKNAGDIKTFLSRTDRTNSVIYPVWENGARRTETLAIIFTFLVLLFMVFPAALAVFVIVLLYAKKRKLFAMAAQKAVTLMRRLRR